MAGSAVPPECVRCKTPVGSELVYNGSVGPLCKVCGGVPTAVQAFRVGDKVNWRHQPSGGWGYRVQVAGVVEELSAKRVRIRAARRIDGSWLLVSKWVDPSKLTHRTKHVEQVDG